MPGIYALTPEFKIKQRLLLSKSQSLLTEVESAAMRGTLLKPATLDLVMKLTQTTDLQKQIDCLWDMRERREQAYLEKLRLAAPDNFTCYVEFMTPDEPPARHMELFGTHLEAVYARDTLRSTVSVPPGHAKTKYFSRMFPSWTLGKQPNWKYLQGGHTQNFAENEYGKEVRGIISDPRYLQVFPNIYLNPRSTAAGNWRLDGFRGGYVCKGVGQGIAGYRAHSGGIDDPFGSREDAESPTIREKVKRWLFADFRTRFLPGSAFFIVATRWHIDDLIGVVEQMTKEGRGIPYDIMNLDGFIETEAEMAADPMGRSIGESLWGEYYTAEHMLELKATLPAADWWSLIKGKPIAGEGNMVQAKWFQRFTQIPRDITDDAGRILEKHIRRVTVSVDCANKPTQRANYSVCTVWIETMAGHHYLVHVVRKKVEITALTKMIEDTAIQWNANAILVEDKGHGTTYIQTRTGKAPAPVIAIQVDGKGKEMRFDDVMPTIESGVVFIPKSAPWLPEYEAELLAFPNGTDDDQVDSTSQYLKWSASRLIGGTKKLRGTNRDTARTRLHRMPGPATLVQGADGVDLMQVKQNFIGG